MIPIALKRIVGLETKLLSNMVKRRLEYLMPISQDTTSTHCMIIQYIYSCNEKGQPVFQKDVEARFQIRRSTTTGILQLMEKNGLITRKNVDYDARLKRITLTSRAIALHKQIVAALTQVENELLNGLSQKEMDIFWKIFDKMKKNITMS